MKLPFFLLSLLVLPSIALGQNRCVENGRVVITDQPCPGQVPPAGPSDNRKDLSKEALRLARAIEAGPGQGYESPYGVWRGQIQFQRSVAGQQVPDAHIVTPVILEIDAQGKMTGMTPEAGCRIKGVAAPGYSPTVLHIDITLSGCGYAAYNRRMTGSYFTNVAQKYGQFSVNATHVGFQGPSQFFEIKGTLRR